MVKLSAEQNVFIKDNVNKKHNACNCGRVNGERDIEIDIDFELPISSKDGLMEKFESISPKWIHFNCLYLKYLFYLFLRLKNCLVMKAKMDGQQLVL